ncbi:MAG: Verru_Chthon cassette protein D [Candidatus Methylacidiphilales bacterium]|nr:Verru_Chthon cassette protein D [Candidatus Methylacidiphilales bacterium]
MDTVDFMEMAPQPLNKSNTCNKRRHNAGFSLLELLVVMGIISILVMILIPVTNGMVQSYQLNSTAQTIQNQLSQARQMAVTSGNAVQVRFYLLPGYQAAASGTPTIWRGMQCFVEGDLVQSGSTSTAPLTPIGMPVFFKAPALILADATRSTIFTLAQTNPTATDKLPAYNLNYKYVSFRFKPTGETDLPETANCVTVVLDRAVLGPQGLPSNFRTLQINANNGSVRSFQP